MKGSFKDMENVPDTGEFKVAQKKAKRASKRELKKSVEYRFLTERQLIWKSFLKNKVAVIAAVILILLYITVLFANFFAPYGMLTGSNYFTFSPPMIGKIKFIDSEGNFSFRPFIYKQVAERDPKTMRFAYTDDTSQKVPIRFFVHGEEYKMLGFIQSDIHLFGTSEEQPLFLFGADVSGRDQLSRIIFGGRVSLSIGIIGVLIMVILGMILGTISGYFGGWTDNLIQRSIEIIRTIPQIALWLALASVIPPRWPSTYVFLGIVVILGFIGWTGLARELRGKVLAIKRADYVLAAEVSGASKGRIIFKHLIPNVASHIIVIATLSIPMMIIGETALSFLGLGIKPPMTSWGVLLTKLREVPTLKHYPWLIIPTIFIVVAVLCFNFLGDALRDASDPYSKK